MGGTSLILTSKPVTSRHLSGLLGLIGLIAGLIVMHFTTSTPPHYPPTCSLTMLA